MTTEPTAPTATDNALHAAQAWLQRLGAHPTAIAVVTVAPRASVGVWTPGTEHIGTLPGIDDAGAELCEATAPVVQQVLEGLPEPVRLAALNAAHAGAHQLQLLLIPHDGAAQLRLIGGGRCAVLATATPSTDTGTTH